jgi:uncharacterized membrane protein
MEENKVDEAPVTQAPEEKKPEEGKNTTMAIIAYLIFFVPLLTDSKNDPFVKYHVKQGMLLFILAVVNALLTNIPLYYMINPLVSIAIIILLVMGIINAANGKMQPVPVIGKFAEQYFKF